MDCSDSPNSAMLLVVCKGEEGFRLKLKPGTIQIPQKTLMFSIRGATCMLKLIPFKQKLSTTEWNIRKDRMVNHISGFVGRVRIVEIIRYPRKITSWLFYRLICKL